MALIEIGNTDVVKLALDKAGYKYESFASPFFACRSSSPKPGIAACLAAKDRVDDIGKRILLDDENYPNKAHKLIGVHQVVYCNQEVWDKPLVGNEEKNRSLARRYLVRYRVETPSIHTAVYVWDLGTGLRYANYAITKPCFERFTDTELETIVSDPVTYQFAGALPYGDPSSPACRIVQSREKRNAQLGTQLVPLPESILATALSLTEPKPKKVVKAAA